MTMTLNDCFELIRYNEVEKLRELLNSHPHLLGEVGEGFNYNVSLLYLLAAKEIFADLTIELILKNVNKYFIRYLDLAKLFCEAAFNDNIKLAEWILEQQVNFDIELYDWDNHFSNLIKELIRKHQQCMHSDYRIEKVRIQF